MNTRSSGNGKLVLANATPVAPTSTTLTKHHQHPHPNATILPARIAQAVTFATRSTCLVIRASSFVGAYGLDAAKFTTLSSLELARGMLEGILTRAGRDIALRPQSDLAAADAETVLERSLESLHYAVSSIVFWTSAGFQLTGTTLSAASELSQLLLCSLDQLFGSTDSSRAIASIITLVRREFNNPATGHSGDKVGVIDLILATSALAYLQQRCRKSIENERRSLAAEEIVWDVVVLNDGERVDVQDDDGRPPGLPPPAKVEDNGGLSGPGTPYLSDTDSLRSFVSHRTHRRRTEDEDAERLIARLKHDISSTLAPGTSVTICNTTATTQTITVDINGPQPEKLPTLPGAEILETRRNDTPGRPPWHSHDSTGESSYRVVYRLQRDKSRTTSFQHHEEDMEHPIVELKDDSPTTPEFDEVPQETPSPPNIPKKPVLRSIVTGRDPTLGSRSPAGDGMQGKISALRTRQTDKSRIPESPTVQSPVSPSIRPDAEPAANQKKPRTPLGKDSSRGNIAKPSDVSTPPSKKSSSAKKKTETPPADMTKSTEKRMGLKQVLKGSGQSLSNIWNKEQSHDTSGISGIKPRPQWKTPGGKIDTGPAFKLKPPPLPRHTKQTEQRASSRGSLYPDPAVIPRSSSRSSFISVHDRRRDSIVSQTDAYSVRSAAEIRPASPLMFRTDAAGNGSTVPSPANDGFFQTKQSRHAGYVPSIYSLATNDSQTSLVLSSYYHKSAYAASDAMSTLRRVGAVQGAFPAGPLLHNISRYMRFASAAYGSHFLKLMGISNDMPGLRTWDETHHDVRHFVHHTDSGSGNVLLASFVDHGGGSDSTGSTDSGVPLVHYISLDHEAKAVVLACRGTLGFEDVLADLTCEYDRLTWRGRAYKVHKGVHASARRILFGGDGKVLIILQEALREFDDYGLVLCGHSLGGGVTALLGLMLSEPNPNGKGFVTALEPQYKMKNDESGSTFLESVNIKLPAGRPIHVFAYGPPGVMSSSLCKITRGLITTVVHGSDIVPYLSLGLLHDLQAAAVAFKKDEHKAKAEIRQRMWSAFQHNVADKFYAFPSTLTTSSLNSDEERWMLPALASLRSNMKSEKLMPPGEVFCLETQRVLRRDAFLLADEDRIGRPAVRIVLRYVRDVGARFGEMRFGTSMLIDHSPAKYEEALRKLRLGVAE